MRPPSTRLWLLLVLLGLPVLYVAAQAVQTLDTLGRVEQERDTWQRPDDVLRALQLRPGAAVVDLGSGAGYFSLKIAPRVEPRGQVFAVDLRRESLAFLWIRARMAGLNGLHVVVDQEDDPRLPPVPVDAVLIANTFHELTVPGPVLDAVFRSMRPGARLVVVDRGPRGGTRGDAAHHEISAGDAEAIIAAHGFGIVQRDGRFIDRPGDEDVWWLLVAVRPPDGATRSSPSGAADPGRGSARGR